MRLERLVWDTVYALQKAGLKSVKELSALAFDVDEELKKENWVAAEKGIREIAKLEYISRLVRTT